VKLLITWQPAGRRGTAVEGDALKGGWLLKGSGVSKALPNGAGERDRDDVGRYMFLGIGEHAT
jgi:hypothetical protein